LEDALLADATDLEEKACLGCDAAKFDDGGNWVVMGSNNRSRYWNHT
jgi:hypothetical protein